MVGRFGKALRLIQKNLSHFWRQKFLNRADVSVALNLLLLHQPTMDHTDSFLLILELEVFEISGRVYVMLNFIDA